MRPRLSIRQVYFAGVLSVLIIAVSGLFVGMVLGLQGYTQLAKFKSADILGYMVAASLLRELGPVLAAILFALNLLEAAGAFSMATWQSAMIFAYTSATGFLAGNSSLKASSKLVLEIEKMASVAMGQSPHN